MYVQFLANTYAAPNTVKNYISGARHWINFHCGNDSAFASLEAQAVLKYNISKSTHVPSQALPLQPIDIVNICAFIDANPAVPLACKPAILIGYFCFLRASNLLSVSLTQWGGPHTLSVSDIISTHSGLLVCIRSTKTLKNQKPVMLTVYPVPHNSCCPVRAWHQYLTRVNPSLHSPAFMIDSVTPLTPRPLVDIMRLALKTAGHKNSDRISMHSLRRGAAQAAKRGGASHAALKAHGTWATDAALNTYLK